jgi:hypothetical protein
MKRQPHQGDPIRRYPLRDRAIEQFQLLLVQSQFDDRLSHDHTLKLYTRLASEIAILDACSRRPMQRTGGYASPAAFHVDDYSGFKG